MQSDIEIFIGLEKRDSSLQHSLVDRLLPQAHKKLQIVINIRLKPDSS